MIDVTEILKDWDGEELVYDDEDKGKKDIPLTLRHACRRALNAILPGDENLSWSDKCDYWELGKRITMNNQVVLTSEEITILKERIAKSYTPIVVGPAVALLDPPAVKKEKTDE